MANENLILYTSIDNTYRLTVTQNSVALDMTGWTVECFIKELRSDVNPVLSLSSDDPSEILAYDASAGLWDITPSATATASLEPGERVLWIQGTDTNSDKHVLAEATITVKYGPEVT